jgi:hypothetical protein
MERGPGIHSGDWSQFKSPARRSIPLPQTKLIAWFVPSNSTTSRSSVVHNPKSQLESTSSNRTWPPRTLKALGEIPEAPAPVGANANNSAAHAVGLPKTALID